MGNCKKNLYLQLVRCLLSASKLVLLSLLLNLLIPVHPFRGENAHWIETLDHAESHEVYEKLKIYSVVRSHMMDLSEASVWAITKTILEESKKHSLDPILVLAVISVESRFQHAAVSTEGARGLMQIRPFVANALAEELVLRDKGIKGLKEDSFFNPSTLQPLDLDDPILNIKLGVFYLRHLKKSFRDLKLALTAYNWGPTEIKNRLEEDELVPLGYAMKVLSAYHSYRKDSRPAHRMP